MKKVLIAYYSRTGITEKMAEYLGEGVRIAGFEAKLAKISDLKKEKDLMGYDGYIFGCPTYHKDITQNMKTFLFLAADAQLSQKVGGAFGSHTHSGEAAPLIFETMEHVLKMDMTTLGPLNLTETQVKEDEGLRACQQYAKTLCEKIK